MTDITKPVTSGAYAQFATDKEMEKKGVILDFGDFWLRIARAGGSNERYTKRVKKLFEPHRRAIQTDTMKDELADKLVRQAYAETVVLEGGSTKFGNGFIEGADGNKMAVDQAGVIQLFTDLPDLFTDVQQQANKVALFRKEVAEADAKN